LAEKEKKTSYYSKQQYIQNKNQVTERKKEKENLFAMHLSVGGYFKESKELCLSQIFVSKFFLIYILTFKNSI